jgi:hypothetical protein
MRVMDCMVIQFCGIDIRWRLLVHSLLLFFIYEKLLSRAALALTVLALGNRFVANAATASPTQTIEHLHTGQKIANLIRSSLGIPDWAVLAIISALPVVELRGAVPVGKQSIRSSHGCVVVALQLKHQTNASLCTQPCGLISLVAISSVQVYGWAFRFPPYFQYAYWETWLPLSHYCFYCATRHSSSL